MYLNQKKKTSVIVIYKIFIHILNDTRKKYLLNTMPFIFYMVFVIKDVKQINIDRYRNLLLKIDNIKKYLQKKKKIQKKNKK